LALVGGFAAMALISAKVTRFEIVMVKRSLEAANAIKAGNTRSRIASVNIIIPLQQAPNLGAARCGFVIVIAKMPFTSAVAKAAAEVNSSVAPHGARSG